MLYAIKRRINLLLLSILLNVVLYQQQQFATSIRREKMKTKGSIEFEKEQDATCILSKNKMPSKIGLQI